MLYGRYSTLGYGRACVLSSSFGDFIAFVGIDGTGRSVRQRSARSIYIIALVLEELKGASDSVVPIKSLKAAGFRSSRVESTRSGVLHFWQYMVACSC